jgi:hypothetical protein
VISAAEQTLESNDDELLGGINGFINRVSPNWATVLMNFNPNDNLPSHLILDLLIGRSNLFRPVRRRREQISELNQIAPSNIS